MKVVQKYGGSSVATIEKIKGIAEHIKVQRDEGKELVIVVSAMGKRTNELISKANEITSSPNKRELDRLLSIGEQETIALFTMALNEVGVDAISLTGYQAGIETKGVHTKSKIKTIDASRIEKHLKDGKVVIIAGFQGVNIAGDITTLGRGGSDTSAVGIAAALGCPCEIYTDVEGIYSIDPRVYEDAKKLEKISYEEMMEMSNLGAGVMEVRAVELGKKYGVAIYVGKTLSENKGTMITNDISNMEEKVITGIGITNEIILVTLKVGEDTPQTVYEIFDILGRYHVNIDMIGQSILQDGLLSLSFSALESEWNLLEEALVDIKKIFEDIEVETLREFSKVSLVGIGMISHSGVASRVFKTFAKEDVKFYQVTTSEISISYAVREEDSLKIARALSEEFNL